MIRAGLLRASARGAQMLLAGSRVTFGSACARQGSRSQKLTMNQWAAFVRLGDQSAAARAFSTTPVSENVAGSAGLGLNTADISATVRKVMDVMKSDEAAAEDDDWHIEYDGPCVELERLAPDFTASAATPEMTVEDFTLSSLRGKWTVLFFYPKDFTFVCPSEIIAFSDAAEQFRAINTELVACSTDSAEVHLAWMRTPRSQGGLGKMNIKIVADQTKAISAKYGVLKEDAGVAFRGLFIISPDGVLKQMTLNNLDVGRSVDETLRLVQAHQFVEEHGVVCPAGWKPGDKVMKGSYEGSREYFSDMYGESDEGTGESEMDRLAPSLKKLTSPAEIKDALASSDKVVLDFYADFCGKCKMLAPTVETLAKENTGIKVFKVDTEAPALKEALANDVTALPTLRFFKSGSQVKELVGYKPLHVKSAFQEL